MTRLARCSIPAVLMLLLALSQALFAVEPSDALLARLQYKGMANDFAGVFTTNQLADLELFLNQVREQTSAEIAVVTLQTLEGGDIDDFANRLFERWGIGKKGKDNGILLLAALQDHKIKIEVGYGLEGALPDAKVGRILDEAVMPAFRENQFAQGMTLGAQAIAQVIAEDAGIQLTNAAALPPEGTDTPAEPMGLGGAIFLLGFFLLFVIVIVLAIKRGGKGSGGSGGSWSSSSSSRSSSSSSSSSGSSSFGGGRSGGGGASRSW